MVAEEEEIKEEVATRMAPMAVEKLIATSPIQVRATATPRVNPRWSLTCTNQASHRLYLMIQF